MGFVARGNIEFSGLARQNGEHPEIAQHFLPQVQKAHSTQSISVQDRKGFVDSSGQTALRQEASWVRRSDQACFPQEGENDQKDSFEIRVHKVQGKAHEANQADKALRARNRQEKKQGQRVRRQVSVSAASIEALRGIQRKVIASKK